MDEIDKIPTTNSQGDEFQNISKSKVKLTKNSKGVNIEVSVVAGEELLIDGLRNEALENYKIIVKELKELEECNK